MGVDARYGTKDPDTCQSGGEGDGFHSITIPTSAECGESERPGRRMVSDIPV